jgi:hypothetical protein
MCSHVYPQLLDWRDQIVNTFAIKMYLPKVYHNQRFRQVDTIDLTPDYLHKSGPKLHTNGTIVNTAHDRLTLLEHREHEKQQRMARAKEYQGLLDRNGWSRAELARQLGVSRAWVTTVLHKSPRV